MRQKLLLRTQDLLGRARRLSRLTMALAAACLVLCIALIASLYDASRHAAHEQAMLAELRELHAQAIGMEQRLSLLPAGTTELMLTNIAKQIGPRFIDAADAETIANTLIPTGVVNFQVDDLSDNPETHAFAREMFNSLLLAGWTPAGPGILNNYTNGVYDVAISAATKTQFPAVYAALVKAFAQAGIAMTTDKTGTSFAPAGTVEIMIGAKQ
jgi:hypothetical protein